MDSSVPLTILTILCNRAKNTQKTGIVFSEQLLYVMTSKWLYAQGRFNYDRGTNFQENYSLNGTGAEILTNSDGTYRGSYNLNNTTTTDINADFLVGGNKQFGKFSVDASIGGNTLRSEFKNMNQSSRILQSQIFILFRTVR